MEIRGYATVWIRYCAINKKIKAFSDITLQLLTTREPGVWGVSVTEIPAVAPDQRAPGAGDGTSTGRGRENLKA